MTAQRGFEYRHIVGFEETNLVGNVYFAQLVRWQGRCRELFLREHAPGVLDELRRGLSLVTTNVSCDYYAEVFAFDEVLVLMRLADVAQNRVRMSFEYRRGETLLARGSQQIAAMRRDEAGGLTATAVPAALLRALEAFR